jgi:hypothetical protein
MTECPSRFTLAEMRAEDLPQDELDRLGAHVKACESCRRILGDIESNAAEYEVEAIWHFSKIKPILETVEERKEPAHSKDRRVGFGRRRLAAVLVPLAAAAVIALMFVPRLHDEQDEALSTAGETAVNFKGAAFTFDVVAKRNERQFKVEPGAVLMPDDALRFIVDTTSGGYLSVFSLDEQKRVSPFYPDTEPEESPGPMKLRGAGRHQLPGSIILDDVRGDEYYVVVFSKNPFDRREVHAKIINENFNREISLQNGPDLYVRSLRVEKRPR